MSKTNKTSLKALTAAMGAAFVAGSTGAVAVDNQTNPFGMQDLDSGYMVAGDKAKEGKCGEGKCGGDKAKKEGKCGEGKCGSHKAKKEGKCGGDKAKKEGKCGGRA
ncbi:MAG: HvfA family oxazolone/thioamide-modified RiPP metallophore [bacterium]